MRDDLRVTLDHLRRGNEDPHVYSQRVALLVRGLPMRRREIVMACNSEIAALHSGQFRGDGAPYVIHPRRVALVCAVLCDQDDLFEAMLISLLHDVVEDCNVTLEALRKKYGNSVSHGVDLLSAPARVGESRADRRARKEDKWHRLEVVGGVALTVHIADILDNVISWRNLKPEMESWEKLPRWLWQATNWYLPLARRAMPDAALEIEAEIEFERERGVPVGSWADA